jgi:hypothetical protein
VKRITERARISQEVTPPVLGHTFSITALQKGISLAAIQKILAHDGWVPQPSISISPTRMSARSTLKSGRLYLNYNLPGRCAENPKMELESGEAKKGLV